MFLFSLYLGLRLSLQNKPWRTTTSFFVDVVYTIHGCPQKSHWPGTWNTLVLYWYVKNMLFQIFCFFKKCTYIGTLNLAKTRTRKPIIIIIMVVVLSLNLKVKQAIIVQSQKMAFFTPHFPKPPTGGRHLHLRHGGDWGRRRIYLPSIPRPILTTFAAPLTSSCCCCRLQTVWLVW